MSFRQPATDDFLADAYLKHYETGDDSLAWAFSTVNGIILRDAERGWAITLALIANACTDNALGYVAAGPLEEMLEVHGNTIIDRVEDLARSEPKFRRALSFVTCFKDSMPETVRSRIGQIVAGL